MEPSTTIRGMMRGIKLIVPTYQRAYSWDTPGDKSSTRNTQTDVFLEDLEEYMKSGAMNPYYFGHFLFEQKDKDLFYVIDGQQRLTTIVIFLSALFAQLKKYRVLNEEERFLFEDIIKRGDNFVHFSTVEYDNQLFKDYVIEQTRRDGYGIDTESQRRIVRCYDFFREKLSNRPEKDLCQLLRVVSEASCTTHVVNGESEAIQMFIFQNSRGKKPTSLEIIKAEFMYYVHLRGKKEGEGIVNEISSRFEKIYKSISSIEGRVDEDQVLGYTAQVYFNSLWAADDVLKKIREQLREQDGVGFIKKFTQELSLSFEHLKTFYTKHEREDFSMHSLAELGGIGIAVPFILKAYKFALPKNDISRLCRSLESLLLRHRLIGTRADLRSRINDVFANFTEENKDIQPIMDRVEKMKKETQSWWAYWNDEAFKRSLQDKVEGGTAKYLLWRYENYLRGWAERGYAPMRYDEIPEPELEHIAPQTEPSARLHGYDEYDEEFRNEYIECIGNYLLVSKRHNRAIGNHPFAVKWETYDYLEQQREIQKMVPKEGVWNKEAIRLRKDKIIRFILDTY